MPGVQIGTPGFRTRQITLVTTLLEAAVYQGDDFAKLYRQRWQLETSLAYLKTTMPMEVLHGQTVVPGLSGIGPRHADSVPRELRDLSQRACANANSASADARGTDD